MDLYYNNQETFDRITELVYHFQDFGYVYEGHRSEEVEKEINKIKQSLEKLDEILDDNYGI